MTENGRKKAEFVWDEVKLKLAEAVAKADRPLNEVLTELEVSERTLYRWKKHPDFQRKIDEIIADIDIAQKAERIKIAKKEVKRVLGRLELNEDHPTSRDLVALLKYIGEELGDYEPKVRHSGEVAVKIIDNIPSSSEDKKDGNYT